MKENGWWSNQTLENYNKTRQCVVNVYDNITEGPFVVNGETKYVSVTSFLMCLSVLLGSSRTCRTIARQSSIFCHAK